MPVTGDGIEEGLILHLLATTAVTDLVGARVYAPDAPQEAPLPYITMHTIDTPRVRHLRGPNGLAHPRIQINCWAATKAAAKQLAKQVRLSNGALAPGNFGAFSLERFQGSMGGYTVQCSIVDDERDLFEEPVDSGEKGVPGVALDVIIWFYEQV